MLSVDIETYSDVDIGTAGLYRYADDPSFAVLLIAYAYDYGPVQLIDLANGDPLPVELRAALLDPAVVKHAYNATFEWYCLSQYLGLPAQDRDAWLAQWRCTMLHGLYCGYPAGLAACGAALGLPEDKRKMYAGRALIRLFCVPCKPSKANGGRTRTLPHHDPDKWAVFRDYCRQDVVTEREIYTRLADQPVPAAVQQQWITDARINARGVAVDMGLVQGAIACSDTVTSALMEEARQLSGLSNPKSVAQLTAWLQAETGQDVPNLRKDTVADLLGKDMDSDAARRMLEIRQELGKTSTAKYAAITAAAGADSRVRGLLQFYGANRTGRWAGRLVQIQNLPRTYLDVLPLARDLARRQDAEMLRYIYGSVPDTLSQLIRTAFVAPAGRVLIDADYSAIEARVIAWLAGEEWVLDVFRTHGKIYEACAAQMFGVPIDRIAKGNPEYDLRQKGKVATLALGYQGGTGALISMGALRMGLAEEELPDIVLRWRRANQHIVALWRGMENAALETIQTGRPTQVHGLTLAMELGRHGTYMTIQLPSGRKLYYVQPSVYNDNGRPRIQYWGTNQTTRKWGAAETYGGKLAENCVQAIARDLLAQGVENLERQGYPVVMHIHDEVVVEGRTPEDLQGVCAALTITPDWAKGLPMAADGWADRYYKKE